MGFDAQRTHEESPKDRLRPPRRHARRASSIQSACHRRRAPRDPLLRSHAEHGRRCLRPLRSTNTTPDHPRPRPHRRHNASQRCCLGGSRPFRRSTNATWVARPSSRRCAPVELPRNRTRSAHAAQVPPIRCDPRGATLSVHYPDPFGSDTFCRELVERSAGEADPSGRFRALAEPALALQPAAGLLSRPSSVEACASRSTAKRSVIHSTKVPSIREERPRSGVNPA